MRLICVPRKSKASHSPMVFAVLTLSENFARQVLFRAGQLLLARRQDPALVEARYHDDAMEWRKFEAKFDAPRDVMDLAPYEYVWFKLWKDPGRLRVAPVETEGSKLVIMASEDQAALDWKVFWVARLDQYLLSTPSIAVSRFQKAREQSAIAAEWDRVQHVAEKPLIRKEMVYGPMLQPVRRAVGNGPRAPR